MSAEREALRQCVEVLKLVDFADCAERPELWHKINAAQQVAEEVLKRPEQEPVAWCVTYRGELTLNIFYTKCQATACKDRLDAKHPEDARQIVPLYAAAPQPAAAPSGDVERDAKLWAKWVDYLDGLNRKPFNLAKDIMLYRAAITATKEGAA